MSIPLPPPFSDPVITCPSCEHGIDVHSPVETCMVGDVAGALCGCPWSPNHIAAEAVRRARADERRKVAEEIARRIERMVPAHPKTWNGKWLVGRRMAADEARRAGLPLLGKVGSK